ncbi:MAG TPA: ABC transporter permease [Chloroflexota bacterium]|nr:ABC transporter permease [Chloroflexota bacterium]
MAKYAIIRIAQAIPTLLLSSIFVFLTVRLIPGGPGRAMLGADAPESQVKALEASLGLDRPLPVQYVQWLWGVLHGNLGQSLVNGIPVVELIGPKLEATLELTIAALIVATIVALALGVTSALRARQLPDVIIGLVSSLLLGIPNFWLGLVLILVFAVGLNWLPAGGRVGILVSFGLGLKFLILPAVTLGLGVGIVQSRYIRTSLLEVLNQDYIRTARAKGLTSGAVVLRHAFRNALIPIITIFGLQIGGMLGGAVVVESVFGWPGLGRLLIDSINNRDYIVVQAGLLYLVTLFVLVNLAVDLMQGVIDPRARRSE